MELTEQVINSGATTPNLSCCQGCLSCPFGVFCCAPSMLEVSTNSITTPTETLLGYFFFVFFFFIQTIWSDRNTSWAERLMYLSDFYCHCVSLSKFGFCLCWTNAPYELFRYLQIFTILVLKISPRTAINRQEFIAKVPCSTRLAWQYIYATFTQHCHTLTENGIVQMVTKMINASFCSAVSKFADSGTPTPFLYQQTQQNLAVFSHFHCHVNRFHGQYFWSVVSWVSIFGSKHLCFSTLYSWGIN